MFANQILKENILAFNKVEENPHLAIANPRGFEPSEILIF